MHKKWVATLFLGCLLVFLAGCASGDKTIPTPTPLPQVVNPEKIIFVVERGSILSQREIVGEVVPAQQDKLFFRASGFITQVLVKNGDRIKKGAILAELQLDDLLDQLQQAQIDLEVSQANEANEKLQKAYDIQQAESEVVIWQKQADLAQNRLEKAVGETETEDAHLNLEIALERLKTAKAYLELIKGKSNTELEQVVKRNQLSVDRLERLVADRRVIAPYDGVVLFTALMVGTQATAYNTAILVGDPTRLVVQASYDYELVNTMEVSTPVYLYLDKAKDPLYPVKYIPDFLPVSNKKEGITTQGDQITINYLFFSMPEDLSADQIPVGSRVYLQVVLGSNEDVLLLPPAAIRGTDEFKYVIVLEDDYHRRVEVISVGVKTGSKWEIIANLKEGDQVLGP